MISFLNELNKKVSDQLSFFKDSGISNSNENITIDQNIKNDDIINKVVVF